MATNQASNGTNGKRFVPKVSLFTFDVLCMCILYFGVLLFRYNEGYTIFVNIEALLVMISVTCFHLFIIGGYDRSTNMISSRFMSEYVITLSVNFLVSLVLIYFLFDAESARAVIAITLVLFPAISIFYRRKFYIARIAILENQNIFVLGGGKQAEEFYQNLKLKGLPHTVRFFDASVRLEGQHLVRNDPSSPLIEGDFLKILNQEKDNVDIVVIAVEPNEIPTSLLEWLIARHFVDTQVMTADSFCSRYWKIIPLSRLSPYWVFEEGFAKAQSNAFERTKRVFDVVTSLSGILVGLPLWLAVAIIIKLTSRGPVFFRQTRIGRHGEIFKIFKFRSMVEGAEKGNVYTQKNDNRITRIGALLRKTRVDEIPQLINVLLGDMSLVGPRPEWDKLVSNYEQNIPYYHFRHLVKPGITGWAQVNYPYGANEHDTIEKLKFDLYYVRNYSFFLDLTICLKTIYVMFFGKGR